MLERLGDMISSTGCEIEYQEAGGMLPEGKEHFGFRDGGSQPGIAGYNDPPVQDEPPAVPPGEFVSSVLDSRMDVCPLESRTVQERCRGASKWRLLRLPLPLPRTQVLRYFVARFVTMRFKDPPDPTKHVPCIVQFAVAADSLFQLA